MGWTYCDAWRKASDVRDELRRDLLSSGYEITKDASTSYGRNYYAAVTWKRDPADARYGRTEIFVALINGGRDASWGYKDMSESMGPCIYDCPLSILTAAGEPAPDETAANWRAAVRMFHAARAASRLFAKHIRAGDLVTTAYPGANAPYTVSSVTPKRVLGYGTNGTLYKLPMARLVPYDAPAEVS